MLFNDALNAMQPKHAKGMATAVLEEQPELLQEFSGLQMSHCFDKLTKAELINGMESLDNEVLGKIATNLPPQLLEQVVTQIDPEVFAKKLLHNFSLSPFIL